MYVCMYVRMYVCMYVCKYVCVYILCMYVCMCVSIEMYFSPSQLTPLQLLMFAACWLLFLAGTKCV